ncbi:MAG: hypothetical protein ACPG5W_09275, partial [Flavobacteriales bacterium]
MKKIYSSFLMLVVACSATMAQNSQDLPKKQFNDSKYAEREVISNTNSRGGGLSCPLTEPFDAAFPAAWTIESTNTSETWAWNDGSSTAGNPDGNMQINYDAALENQDESMVTDAIDLSVIPNPGLYFDWFASYFWAVTNNNYDVTISVSTDMGTNWTDVWSEDDEGEFETFEWATVVLDLAAYSSETSVMFRFNYSGNDGAEARFDNINFCSLPSNDLRVTEIFTGDIENDYLYTRIPVTQAVEVVAGGVADNFGIAAQTNVMYAWLVTFDGDTVASGTEPGPATMAAGDIDSVSVATGYTPSAVGEIGVRITVSADEIEEAPTNNAMDNGFEVTEYVWGHDYEDEGYALLGYETGDDDAAGGFEFGADYFCQVDGDMIYALQFPLSNTTTSQSVIVKVYQDETTNGAVSETVYDIQPGDLSSGSVNFITVVLDDPVAMASGSVYTATVA